MDTVYTTCRYCEAACGLAVQVENNRVQKIVADKANPQTWRDICAKGLTAHELTEHKRRITAPMKRVGDRFVEVSYEEAVLDISTRLRHLINEYGADSIGYYHGNPLGFTSGILFSLGFIDGIGTRNRYNVGSVDQNNNHVVSDALFELPYVPFNPDIDHCDYFLLIGMNPVESKFSWLGNASDGWARARKKQAQGSKLVVVDPRRTRTAKHADQHLVIRPGQDWALLLGILHFVFRENLQDQVACAELPEGQLRELQQLAVGANIDELASRSGISACSMHQIAREFSMASGAMCLTQTGVSMHTTGTIGHWLGLVLEIVTGHLDQPGGRRFDTGYVNMTEFAAQVKQPETPSRVRQQPTVMGNRSLCELPDEIMTSGPGQIKAMLIHSGNPVVSGPNGDKLDEALASLDMVIAIDLVQRESHRHADWLIPGVHWLERGELLFNLAGGMDKPFAQYSRQALEPPPGVRPEWDFFIDLALATKVPFMGYRGLNTLIRLSRTLSRWLNKPHWAFSPSFIERLMLSGGKVLKWKTLQAAPHGLTYGDRRYGLLEHQRKGQPVQIAPAAFCQELNNLLECTVSDFKDYPYTLIGKRTLNMMNSWMMELPNMQKRHRANDCEINPADATRIGIKDGDDVEVSSRVGCLRIKAVLSDDVPEGIVCIQHGWGSRVFDPAGGGEPEIHGVNPNRLVDHTSTDPFSGTPDLNSTRVAIKACRRLESASIE